MTDVNPEDHASDPASNDGSESIEMATASGSYKVLGLLSDPSGGIGVLGRNEAASGTTRGVVGRVASPDGFGLETPDAARIDGPIESTGGHTLTVDGTRALRLGPAAAD